MVSNDILVAPVVYQGMTSRQVYLPEGIWIDFWSGIEYTGKNTILIDAPLDKLPLFVKKDTLLPWGKSVSHISDDPDKTMTFRLFGDHGEYEHYQDNGIDFNYQKGEYNLYDVKVNSDEASVKLLKHGYQHQYKNVIIETTDNNWIFEYNKQKNVYIKR